MTSLARTRMTVYTEWRKQDVARDLDRTQMKLMIVTTPTGGDIVSNRFLPPRDFYYPPEMGYPPVIFQNSTPPFDFFGLPPRVDTGG